MTINKIIFKTNKTWLSAESKSAPQPIIKSIPDWFRKADRYAKDDKNNFIIGPDNGKIPTWKACPAIFDIMSTGYSLNTPCDIEFFKNADKEIDVKIKDIKLSHTHTISSYLTAASLILTSATFLIALEHNGCNVRVVTRKAFAFAFASILTRQPTLILLPFISLAPVRNVPAAETVHGVGSTPLHRPNFNPSTITLATRSI